MALVTKCRASRVYLYLVLKLRVLQVRAVSLVWGGAAWAAND